MKKHFLLRNLRLKGKRKMDNKTNIENYDSYFALVNQHKITKFTPLQDRAFHLEEGKASGKNLFVIGQTSSGKTLIPMLLYEAAVIKAQKLNIVFPKMLFVVPFRALAAQKLMEFSNFFKKYGLKIVQSTEEFRSNDYDIQNGNI